MAWTEKLSDKQNKLLINDICPTCETKTLEQVSSSGRTVNCPKCKRAYIKPTKQPKNEANEFITPESIQAIIDYINEGEPDLNVVKGELGELIARHNNTYNSIQK